MTVISPGYLKCLLLKQRHPELPQGLMPAFTKKILTGFCSSQDSCEYLPMANIPFYLSANKKAIMKVHDATVIDADYGYTAGEERQGSMNLKAGLHPFRIYYAGKEAVRHP